MAPLDMQPVIKINGARHAKALVVCVAIFLGAALNALGVDLTLGWDASPDAHVTGYKMYYGKTGLAKQTLNVGNTTRASLPNLLAGHTYEFYVTAYDATGAESDPSNQITYTIPGSTTLFKLSITGFKDGYVSVSPRGTGTAGNLYPAGSLVNLTATAKPGALFTGWNINGLQYTGSQITIPIAANTTVSPVFKKFNGSNSAASASNFSMSIEQLNAQTVLNIGGEAGAWALEMSTNMVTWQRIATGITSERLPISNSAGNGFFRVRVLEDWE